MGTTGVIFTAIAIAWLAYLVPHFARRRDDVPDTEDPTTRFSDSVRVVRHGTAPLLNQDLATIDTVEVSTPLTRRAAVEDLRRLQRRAAARRRRALVVLLALVTVAVCLAVLGYLPWWSVAVPGGLLVAFVVIARLSVRGMHRKLDARYRAISQGSEEATVLFSRRELAGRPEAGSPRSGSGVGAPGRLWEPIPVTVPTYVSKPLAPRTVRTIDLSGPPVVAHGSTAMPVTADAPGPASEPESAVAGELAKGEPGEVPVDADAAESQTALGA